MHMDAILPGMVGDAPMSQRPSYRSGTSVSSPLAELRGPSTSIRKSPQELRGLRSRVHAPVDIDNLSDTWNSIQQRDVSNGAIHDELECQMRCGYLGNPHWQNMCSRCFYAHALLPALAYNSATSVDQVSRPVPKGAGNNASSWTVNSSATVFKKTLTSMFIPAPEIAQGCPISLACISVLEVGLFVFSMIVNGGLQPLAENPLIGPSANTLHLVGGLYIWDGKEPWRLISCMFLHAGVLHMIPNILVQWWAGYAVELLWGGQSFAVIYVAAGVGGSLLSAVLSTRGVISVGASGALHGILAARLVSSYGLVLHGGDADGERFIWRLTAFGLAASLALGMVRVSDALPRVDSWSHLGGTIVGFSAAAALLWRRSNHIGGKRDVLIMRASMALLGLTFVCVCIYGLGCEDCYEPPGSLQDVMVR